MSVQVEKSEKNMAKLTIEVPAEELDKAITEAYKKQKSSFNIPGFRKGKVPQVMIEKMYGAAVFYEDAANILLPQTYPAAADESGLDIVSRPTIDFVQLEKGKSFIYTAEVAVKPEVKLGKYIGVTVTREAVEVTEDEINAEIEKERQSNARTISVEDRAIENGDTAVIDFEGFVDGVAFEGGKGENHPLEIGSGSFIPGFEEQLIGKNVGEDVEVNVTFPEDYHSEDLAGKAAVFKCKIHEVKVKELPELDDEFAQDVSEFDTMDEYKASVENKIKEQKEEAQKHNQEDEAIKKIIEDSEMDIPDPMVDTQVDEMINQFAQSMQQQGLSLQQYMQITGVTMDGLREQVRPDALSRIQSSLVLDAIVEAEKIEISDEQVEEDLKKMSEMYNMDIETLKGYMGPEQEEAMKGDLAAQAALKLVMDSVKYQEKQPEAEEAAEE